MLSGRPRRDGARPGELYRPYDQRRWSHRRRGRADGGTPAWSRKREAYLADETVRPIRSTTAFAELHAHSAFSFLDGASSPEEMVEEAVRLDLKALALTDHDGFYGIVRFAEAAREFGLPTVFGAELSLGWSSDSEVGAAVSRPAIRTGVPDPPGEHLLVLARGPEGYRRLSRRSRPHTCAAGRKGSCIYNLDELSSNGRTGDWLILTGCRKGRCAEHSTVVGQSRTSNTR